MTLEVQRALIARGHDLGKGGADGVIGPATLGAMLMAPNKLSVTAADPPKVSTSAWAVPGGWMPWAIMLRIIVHGTAGGPKANADDCKHCHLPMEGDARLARGTKLIADNLSVADGVYAAHSGS